MSARLDTQKSLRSVLAEVEWEGSEGGGMEPCESTGGEQRSTINRFFWMDE